MSNVIKNDFCTSLFHGSQRHDAGSDARAELCARLLFEGYGTAVDFIDIIVAGHEQQRTTILEDLHHLALELTVMPHLLQEQVAIGPFLQTEQVVIAANPNRVLAVTIDHRDPTDIGCMDNAPPCTVVIE